MTTSIIISICLLLILAYIFDITSSKTKIPSVILLLIVGWAVKQATNALEITVPNLTSILPVLGTVGLILIVMEGSLELELNKSKFPFIGKTALVAILPMLLFSFGLAFVFQYFGNISFKVGLANAIPLAVISSAIAIPSSQNLISKNKEFITYESSLSDIFGVILFNFITLNDNIGAASIGEFIVELFIILVITFVATLGLAFLLSKIKHPVKFIPIILSIVLIYSVSKVYHLPGLIFILLFGLFLGNLDELKSNKFIQKLQPNLLNKEVHKFKELTTEIAFLVRALFFLLFGYLIETHELLNTETIVWAVGICAAIFALRYISLKIFKLKIKPLLFIAPRGLITILLFLSIPENQVTDLVNNSLVIQVIILSALIMMFGLMTNKETIDNDLES
ncbi:sodium:proton antiporter [Flavobacterium sp. 5]|uniref:sodium:proton antiporter n=1 Tax=Flavobacterium sp. 5 TaxID=2035199 RepID=UPI000C2C5733|nr:sodium:proton antiporter [Flavobacterium sp. 5]PKB15429.1 sodium/proton antiporter (CPA1 family) [Flavobacterium sp. 5]